MKKWILIAGCMVTLSIPAYIFQTELLAVGDLIRVKLKQRSVCKLMGSENVVSRCLELVSSHDGGLQIIQLDGHAELELPLEIVQESPSSCMISTNTISFVWNMLPWCFWTLEVSQRTFNLAEMTEYLAGNEYTKDLDFNVIDHGHNWVVYESFN